MSAVAAPGAAVAWHDAECGSYAADLPLWRALASGGGRVFELGCGTGRVALDLAARGAEVTGVERDPALLAELSRRARERGLTAGAVAADVREEWSAPGGADLVLAPMQLIQLLASAGDRARALERIAAALRPGGLAAFALLEAEAVWAGDPAPLPDVVEREGFVFSSLPLAVRRAGELVRVERLRQTVSPAGELTEELDVLELALLAPGELEAEAAPAGLRPVARLRIAATEEHVGSVVVVVEREGE